MADTIKNEVTLQAVMNFGDGDTRTISVNEPQDSITSAQIEDLSDYIAANQVFIGDKAGAPFVKISKAFKRTSSIRTLDLAS